METPGLTTAEAQKRGEIFGKNVLPQAHLSTLRVLALQFANPLIYLLILAAAISFLLSNPIDALTILIILLANALLGFVQEFRSEHYIEKLREMIKKNVLVRRDAKEKFVLEEDVVPGDILLLREGDVVCADGVVKFSEAAIVDESLLTGESVPVIKKEGEEIFAGTTIVRGYIEAEIATTGQKTKLGKIASLGVTIRKKSEYEKAVGKLSTFLLRITAVVLLLVLGGNLLLRGLTMDTLITVFLFVLALSIGIVPEALPVISTLTLSRGALILARHSVIAKRLSAVEDLGNIEILCTDKTGTITQNALRVTEINSPLPKKLLVYANFCLEGQDNIDRAIRAKITTEAMSEIKDIKPVAYLPFDPGLRRRWALVEEKGKRILIVLGSPEEVLSLSRDGKSQKSNLLSQIKVRETLGVRHIVLAYKEVGPKFSFRESFDDKNLTYLGSFGFVDPLRETAAQTINQARKLGVQVKIITGDSLEVARNIAQSINLGTGKDEEYFAGPDLLKLDESQFARACETGVVFARVTPEQKFQIIQSLKQKYVVGFQGDGINDALGLKAASVGIAVNNAADIAREAADIILMTYDLKVVIEGIESGRKIFFNIDKYVKHTMVSNWGNFFAVAAVSFFTTTLPLLPIQILLTGLLSDLPLLAVAFDNVDSSDLHRPARYHYKDVVLLPLLLGGFTMLVNLAFFYLFRNLSPALFRTFWFVLITVMDLVVIFSVRRIGPMTTGAHPSRTLLFGILATVAATIILPESPLGTAFHLVNLSPNYLLIIIAVTILYLSGLDFLKVNYYRLVKLKR